MTTPPARPVKTALTNVRVFDGRTLLPPTTVVIDGAVLGTDPAGAVEINGGGGVLLPGLIDAHVHLHGPETLITLARFGVTTALDMACWPPARVRELRQAHGTTDIRSAGTPAIGPAGPHSHIPGMAADAVVTEPGQARGFVVARIAEGSDYLKVVLEAPGQGGPDRPVVEALVLAAHAAGKKVIAHAATPGAYALALSTDMDVITHVPLGHPLSAEDAQRMAAQGQVAIPTLTMMERTAAARGLPPAGLAAAVESVRTLLDAGVTVLAGTDANSQPGVPAQVPHGESLHRELELLVEAGLTPAQALQAATTLTAGCFDLQDRGSIAPGLRADLVLLRADPTEDIRAVRQIERVWCAGVEHSV